MNYEQNPSDTVTRRALQTAAFGSFIIAVCTIGPAFGHYVHDREAGITTHTVMPDGSFGHDPIENFTLPFGTAGLSVLLALGSRSERRED